MEPFLQWSLLSLPCDAGRVEVDVWTELDLPQPWRCIPVRSRAISATFGITRDPKWWPEEAAGFGVLSLGAVFPSCLRSWVRTGGLRKTHMFPTLKTLLQRKEHDWTP